MQAQTTHPDDLTSLELLAALLAVSGTHVRVRDVTALFPAERIGPGVDRVKIYHGMIAMTREHVIERLRDFSSSSRRRFHDVVKASVPQSNGQTFLPIVAVVDEPDESGTVWASLHLRRTKLFANVRNPHAAARPLPPQTLLPRED